MDDRFANLEKGIQTPWSEAGPPRHHDDKVGSDQQVVDQELSLIVIASVESFGGHVLPGDVQEHLRGRDRGNRIGVERGGTK